MYSLQLPAASFQLEALIDRSGGKLAAGSWKQEMQWRLQQHR
jgi:hypothetical protein